MKKYLLGVGLFSALISVPVEAGVFELGTTLNMRASKIDKENYTKTKSVTGSLSYYFWEMSAIELSYTSGYSETSIKIGTDPLYVIKQNFELMGLDLIFTLASRQSVIQPYIKLGGAYIKKKVLREVGPPGALTRSDNISPEPITVPSAGLGIKFAITEGFSIKAGVDAWPTDPKNGYDDLDYAARAGISWMF